MCEAGFSVAKSNSTTKRRFQERVGFEGRGITRNLVAVTTVQPVEFFVSMVQGKIGVFGVSGDILLIRRGMLKVEGKAPQGERKGEGGATNKTLKAVLFGPVCDDPGWLRQTCSEKWSLSWRQENRWDEHAFRLSPENGLQL